MKTYLYYIISYLLLLSSCKNYLDTYPSNSLVSGNGIETEEELIDAVNGMYNGLLTPEYYGNDFIMIHEVQGADMQTNPRQKKSELYYRFAINPTNSPIGLWKIPYLVINRANTILESIENNAIPPTLKVKDAKGQALAVRALCHFNLLLTYGYPYLKNSGTSLGVPLVNKVIPAEALSERVSVFKGYEMVIRDLLDALKFIGEDVNPGYFNHWAVKSLLARVYLYQGNWDQAFIYAENVILNSPYELIPNDQYLNSWKAEVTSESIFDLHFSVSSLVNTDLIGYTVHPNGKGALIPTRSFLDLLHEDSADIRLGLLQFEDSTNTYFLNKYPGRNEGIAVNNIRILRLSDIYLIAAEAALKKSSPEQDKADKYLNCIIKRANAEASDVIATEERILKERRKELVLEGHQFFDAMRLGKKIIREGGFHFLNPSDLVNPDWNDFRIVKPIPEYEINSNKLIRDQQNPGYN